MKELAILQWKGGKFALADFIISRMPTHKRYCEVFFGGGHVFWQKGLAQENIVNDLNRHLTNLYKVMADETKYKALVLRLRNTIYSRDLFDEYCSLYWNESTFAFLPDVERAFIFLYLNKVSFNGEFHHFAVRPDASVLYNIESKVIDIHNKLRAGGTVIENMHFKNFIPQYDSKDTFFYVDPPYIVTTTSQGSSYYEKNMRTEEHETLYEILKDSKGKWLLSYDDVEVIRDVYSDYHIIETPKMHQSSATASGKSVFKSELLIANYDIETAGTIFDAATQ